MDPGFRRSHFNEFGIENKGTERVSNESMVKEYFKVETFDSPRSRVVSD